MSAFGADVTSGPGSGTEASNTAILDADEALMGLQANGVTARRWHRRVWSVSRCGVDTCIQASKSTPVPHAKPRQRSSNIEVTRLIGRRCRGPALAPHAAPLKAWTLRRAAWSGEARRSSLRGQLLVRR